MRHVAELLDERLDSVRGTVSVTAAVDSARGGGPSAPGDDNPLRAYLAKAWRDRPCNRGPPRHSAMPARLRDRSAFFAGPEPALHYTCRMCEAEFPNREAFEVHQARVHGGQRWYQSQYEARCELGPYLPSPTEERQASGRQGSAPDPLPPPQRRALSADAPGAGDKGVECFCFSADKFGGRGSGVGRRFLPSL